MPRLAEAQRAFARSIFDPDGEIPANVTSHTGGRPKRRFDVYRNNVHVSLIDVLAGRFPVVARLVGDDFFRATARCHVRDSPPRSPVLMEYGEGFPDFLAEFEPARHLHYLPDVARIEWAWSVAYHAADREPLTADALAAVPPDRAAELRFDVHPSLGLVSSPFPVFSIWAENTGDDEFEPVALDAGGEDVLILRPRLEVEVRALPPGALFFIRALRDGDCMGAASERALAASPDFDLRENIAGLISSGAVTGFDFAQDGV